MDADPDEKAPLASDKLSAEAATAQGELQQALNDIDFKSARQ
jgi:hypothetical protein